MELLTQKKSCEILGISQMTFNRWVRDGKAPPPVVINGRKWYTQESLNEWIKGQTEGQK